MGESVEAGPFVYNDPFDIQQINSKAKNCWLSQPEICQILQNHERIHISAAPLDKPRSGSLFLFDRTVQRYFRNDGHNWKKKSDGKTLSEGNRLFEVEGFGNLRCYYARGKVNEDFRRRCYWMPTKDFSHIVLVHYLEETALERGNSQSGEPCLASISASDTDYELEHLTKYFWIEDVPPEMYSFLEFREHGSDAFLPLS